MEEIKVCLPVTQAEKLRDRCFTAINRLEALIGRDMPDAHGRIVADARESLRLLDYLILEARK